MQTVAHKIENPTQQKVENLQYSLSQTANDFFRNLLKIPKMFCDWDMTGAKILAAGDCDGSIARMILLAMQSNHVELDKIGLDKLVLLLEYEALIMTEFSYPKVGRYQHNGGISEILSDLVNKHITFQASEIRLIFIGDLLHDRMSCNKTVTINLIIRLYEIGVIFILGNHDVYRESYTVEGRCLSEGGQFGEYAIDKGNKTWDEWQEFEKKYFINCYYDNESNYFFIHNGINYTSDEKRPSKKRSFREEKGCRIWKSYDGVEEVHRTFDIAIFSDRKNIQLVSLWFKDENGDSQEFNLNDWPELKALVDCYVNFDNSTWRDHERLKLFLDNNRELAREKGLYIRSFGYYQTAFGDIEASSIEELSNKINTMSYKPRNGWFTDFRPEDDSMGDDNGLFSENEITIIHGHHGFFPGTFRVVNINSRHDNKFSTSALFLGTRRSERLKKVQIPTISACYKK